MNPARAGAFTAADETKLDGIEAGAQVNPLNVIKFSGINADADTLSASEIGFYDGTTDVQSGSLSQVDRLYVPAAASTFGQDATQPGTDLSAVDTTRYFENIVDNGGSVLFALVKRGETAVRWVKADTTSAVTGGYLLTNLTWHNPGTILGTGYSWNVVAGHTEGVLVSEIVDNEVLARTADLAGYVKKTDLEGHETDEYSSYTNGVINSGYRSGSWSLFTGTGAPTGSGIGQPDIASGSGVVVFGRTRTDRDPNKLTWGPVPAAADYPSGRVIHAYVEGSQNPGHVRVTLTGAGTLVGTGDAAYVWAPASWVEVGDVGPVDEGNWWRLSEYEPSDLDLRIPAADVVDPPWVLDDGSNVTEALKDAIQGANEDSLLENSFRVDGVGDYRVTFTPGSPANICVIRLPSSAAGGSDDLDLQRLAKPAAWVEIGDYFIDITTNYTRSIIGTGLNFTFNYVAVSGTQPTGADLRRVRVIGEDVHRGQIARQAFRDESPSIDGKGGTQGQVWRRGSNAENAGWEDETVTLPDQTGHGGQFLKTDGTDADWAAASLLNFYDSGTLTNADDVNNHQDTDAIPMPSMASAGIVETENIANFGTVYKTAAMKRIDWDFNIDSSLGVAIRLRYSTTKPTASDDAKTFGDQAIQVNDGTAAAFGQYDSPANRYWFFTLSGGGQRTLIDRSVRLRASYEAAATGDITGVTAGDGLTGGGTDGDVSLAVDPGDGIENSGGKVRVKLDGTTLARGSDGLSVANPFTDADETKLDGIAAGAEVNVNADWTASSGDAEIFNKPTIPSVPNDSQIGDKAFSNPPGTLTNAEKEDVRAAIAGGKLVKSVAGSADVTLTADEGDLPQHPLHGCAHRRYHRDDPGGWRGAAGAGQRHDRQLHVEGEGCRAGGQHGGDAGGGPRGGGAQRHGGRGARRTARRRRRGSRSMATTST